MKNRKSLIALFFIFVILLVGITIAYFTNIIDIENIFKTKQYGTTVTEEFVSPDNWLPGQTTDKIVYAENSGEIDEAVRISITEKWVSADGAELSGLIDSNGYETDDINNSARAAILNLENTDDWVKEGNYYYYKYKISPGEITGIFLKSVTFNKKTDASFSCSNLQNEGITQYVDCDSTENSYSDATYKLSLKIETVQYDKYKEAWNTNFNIENKKYVKGLPVNADIAKLSLNNQDELFTFNHDATEQTPKLTDYRYIGIDPDNYVYFNCTDEFDYSTCEIWRIVGIFDVDDGTGNYEQRIKIVRGVPLLDKMPYDEGVPDVMPETSNNWAESTLKSYLNETYYNSLSESSKNMIGDAKYYLSSISDDYNQYAATHNYGDPSIMYIKERGNDVYEGNPMFWIGKIALLYPSDNYYTYAKGINDKCYNEPNNCSDYAYEYINGERVKKDIIDADTGWIYNGGIRWVLTPKSNNKSQAFDLYSGSVHPYDSNVDWDVIVRPTLYLKANVNIVSGNGREDNPYKLSQNNSIQQNFDSIINYEEYYFGDTITYKNELYYVIKDSNYKKNYVTLLKDTILTASEINNFNNLYISVDGEYPFLVNEECNENVDPKACRENPKNFIYDNSDLKKILDKWAQNKYGNDLQMSVDGYKVRLLTIDDISKKFDYNYSGYGNIGMTYYKSDLSPSWVYIDEKKYWTMAYNYDMCIVYGNGVKLCNNYLYGMDYACSHEAVYNKLYIRPVINLKKCAIDNTCE